MKVDKEKCPDDWHLSWEQIIEKYGMEKAVDINKGRTCPTCKEKRVYGD